MRRLLLILTLLPAIAMAPALAAQRQTGVVGAYVPPRDWPQEARRFDLLHQKMEIRFDVPHRELFGTVTTRVAITLAPTDTVRLNAENLTIDKATDARGKSLRFTADTSHVTVRLGHKAQVGDTVEFTLQYHGIPERGLYFVPRRNVVWSQGEATETRAWVPTYDAPNDKTTWEFLVTADSQFQVLSNGHLVDVTPVNGGAQRVWHWSEDKPASTYLYSVVIGPFAILKDQWRGRPVEYWVSRDTIDAGWRTFGETPSMIELYSQLLGVPFQWDKYDESVIPDFTYGGMENVSATTQTDLALHPASDEPQGNGRSLNAHELAHQWFGDLTTTATWAHIWLNEELTTYMESVQAEKTRGWSAGQLEWWEQQQEAMAADRNEVRALVWGKYEGTDPIALFFSGHVYPKGAQLAHQMRRLLGDSLFWAGMHRFLTDNAFKPVTTADYAVAMEKTCNCDLDWFFDQWAYGIGYPKVTFKRHWAPAISTLHVIVAETQPIDSIHPFFRFPATIRVITRDSVVRQQIMVTKVVDTFAIKLPSEPLSFRFDEGGWLLGQVTGDQTPAELAEMARHDLDFAGRNWALQQLGGVEDTSVTSARRFIVLNEHEAWLRMTALRQMAKDTGAATLAVVTSALRDPAPEVRDAALATLYRLDPKAGAAAADPMYRSDPNDPVRQTALTVLAQARGADALPLLVAASGPDNTAGIRYTAARQLGRLGGTAAEDALVKLTASVETRSLRGLALNALAITGDSARATGEALSHLGDYDPLFAVQAVYTVGRMGGAAGKAKLAEWRKTERRVTVNAAIDQVLARH
ncbi:MAG TPA: M1 family aminopeptidase [Gemmatimonadales bacterium]|nr:M1 family aminopeptidase [Gemmatimonadales bacterium]